jgi:DNA-binding response OmpR family regulator
MTNTILVVDDDAALRGLLKRVLTLRGYRVIEAATLGTALGMLGAFTPDLAIVDAALPDGHGGQVCRTLKKTLRGLPVMMISGEPSQAGSAPVDEFLAKPFDMNTLSTRVESLLAA